MFQPSDIDLTTTFDYASLSLKDLLEARDQYHFHLMNKKHVIGTAVGRYLIRNSDPYPTRDNPSPSGPGKPRPPRTFQNSSVRDYSWPCVLVLVDEWVEDFSTMHGHHHPEDMVPRTLYMPDGRTVPVCVVWARPAAQVPELPQWTWPSTKLSPGYPIVIEHQNQRRIASVGCLVTDGHTTYALTNRHVCGSPGEVVYTMLRGKEVRIGEASAKQATRVPFTEIYPDYPGRRTYLNLDIGLVELDDLNVWSSSVFDVGAVGELFDFHEANLGFNMIEGPVVAHGAASGRLDGRIKALFYRYKAVGGYDYVADLLIAPTGDRSTRLGDSGTVWHFQHKNDGFLPVAVEWGAQALSAEGAHHQYNFALATSLSNVCKWLDVELVQERDLHAVPTWGQMGHYSIGTFAVDAIDTPDLRALMNANLDSLSFAKGSLDPKDIKAAATNVKTDFIPLADVPDLVWKQLPSKIPGGRDHAAGLRSTGPEHPTHYADIDEPHPTTGKTLRQMCIDDPKNVDVAVWQKFYDDCGHKDQASRGLLPFRVWQFFDVMVAALQDGDVDRFVCAAGVVSHYVGDACQPLHGSIYSDGYKDQPTTITHTRRSDKSTYETRSNVGAGVHSTYETNMIDAFAPQIVAGLGANAKKYRDEFGAITNGKHAAIAIVNLMEFTATMLPPRTIVDKFIAAGEKNTKAVQQALWRAFGDQTIAIMRAGADLLAAIWDAAWTIGRGDRLDELGACDTTKLRAIYTDPKFAPSLDPDSINKVLGASASVKQPERSRKTYAAHASPAPRRRRRPRSR